MKASLKAHRNSLSLTRIRNQLTTKFVVDEDVKSILRTWFTREWLAEYVRKQISGGQITYDGIHYNIVWHGVTPADYSHHKWFLSFRAPVIGIECLPYVLITVKHVTAEEYDND